MFKIKVFNHGLIQSDYIYASTKVDAIANYKTYYPEFATSKFCISARRVK